MKVDFDSKAFVKDMMNILDYSVGYLEGIHKGKKDFLDSVGTNTVEVLKQYLDSMARIDPAMLQHVYEWNQTGSPDARLFDITYTVSNLGLSLKSTFRQSSSIKSGSNVPFYDKARIMEDGVPVVIRPKNASVLTFDDNGEQVFTRKPISVDRPGGKEAQGGYQSAFDSFFRSYFSQAFLRSSGMAKYLESPKAYKNNMLAGKSGGKSAGVAVGYRWILEAGAMIK